MEEQKPYKTKEDHLNDIVYPTAKESLELTIINVKKNHRETIDRIYGLIKEKRREGEFHLHIREIFPKSIDIFFRHKGYVISFDGEGRTHIDWSPKC
jgi:hypothetical protein